MNLDAILFDMDGLLFDTESLGIGASHEAVKEQGFLISHELQRLMLGTNKEKSNELLLSELPDLDTQKFWVDFDASIWRHVENKGLPVMHFAAELLAWGKEKGLVMGLCSGSPRHVVERYLQVAGMAHYFEAILAGDDDENLRSKPAPDMYLRTAQMLGLAPANCLVLEDSPNGLRAGRAAGMHTVMVPDLIPYTEALAPFCDAVFDNLSHLPAYIESLPACP